MYKTETERVKRLTHKDAVDRRRKQKLKYIQLIEKVEEEKVKEDLKEMRLMLR